MRFVKRTGAGRNRQTVVSEVLPAFRQGRGPGITIITQRRRFRRPAQPKQTSTGGPGAKPREGNAAKRGKRFWWACWLDEQKNIVLASCHYTEQSAANKCAVARQEFPETSAHYALEAENKAAAEVAYAKHLGDLARAKIAQDAAPPLAGTEHGRTHEHEPHDSTPPLGWRTPYIHFLDREDGTPTTYHPDPDCPEGADNA